MANVIVTSGPYALNKAGVSSVLRHVFLPLLAQGLIEVLQGLDIAHLSPTMYILVTSATQGAIQFLNKFLREHKSVEEVKV